MCISEEIVIFGRIPIAYFWGVRIVRGVLRVFGGAGDARGLPGSLGTSGTLGALLGLRVIHRVVHGVFGGVGIVRGVLRVFFMEHISPIEG